MFSIPKRPRPVPVLLEDTSFQFYFVIHQHERHLERCYSPYYLLGGHFFRLIFSSNLDKNGVGVFLQCSGPDTTGNDTTKKESRIWSCAVGFRLRLLHPSKWAALNIDPETSDSGLLPPNFTASIPAYPKDHVSEHQKFFQYDDHTGSGLWNWAAHALLQPGLFCDYKHNIVVVAQFDIHDQFNAIRDNASSNEPTLKYLEFKEALEERSAVVNKLVECDEFLRECKAPAVALTLENEIKTLERALLVLPSLHNFL